jgi:hypothetical protein
LVSHLFRQVTFGVPKTMCLLHRQPQTRAVAAKRPDTDCHFRRYGRALRQDAVQHLTRNTEHLGGCGNSHAQRREDVFSQYRARVGGLSVRIPVGRWVIHFRLPLMVVFKIDIDSVQSIPTKYYAPRAVDMECHVHVDHSPTVTASTRASCR